MEAFNEAAKGRKISIGKGTTKLKDIVGSLSPEKKPVSFIVGLNYVDKKGKALQKGLVEIKGNVSPMIASTASSGASKNISFRIANVSLLSAKALEEVEYQSISTHLRWVAWEGKATNFQIDPLKKCLSWQEGSEVLSSVVPATAFEEGSIEVRIYKGSTEVASGSIDVKRAGIPSSSFSKEAYSVKIELTGDNKCPFEGIQLHIFVEEEDQFLKFTAGKLLVKKIVCHDLPNAELLTGTNDPYVDLKFGTETRQTEVIDEGGCNPTFDLLDISIDVQRDQIEYEMLRVKVMDKNTLRSNTTIGEGSLSLLSLLHHLDTVVELHLQLTDAKQKPAGKITLFAQLVDRATVSEDMETNIIPIDPNFKEGIFQISTVRGFGLKSASSLLGSTLQNPYLRFHFLQWAVRTSYLDMSVHKVPIFENLGLETEVTLDQVLSSRMRVEVQEANTLVDATVGSGECSIRPAAMQLGKEVELKVDLAKGSKPAGHLIIFCKIVENSSQPQEDLAAFLVPRDFPGGILSIHSIKLNNLNNVEMIGQQVCNVHVPSLLALLHNDRY